MARAIIAVLDSLGVGASSDAAAFGDAGADTFGHIVEACANGEGNRAGLREGPLRIPNLTRLGMVALAEAARALPLPGVDRPVPEGLHGFAAEQSRGKDTPSGHWEMAGLPVDFDWGYFEAREGTFPPALLDALISEAALPGVLGNCHASGTAIIEALGEEHLRTLKPIVYTSADSVLQIAAHEEAFGLDRLYEVCKVGRRLVDDYNVGRVIARPFTGHDRGSFVRTGNRRDLVTPPHGPTLLDQVQAAGGAVVGVGKISDIFGGCGITKSCKAVGNDTVMEVMLEQMASADDGSLIFANFVDFDMLYGHRRDVAGYAAALERFDSQLPAVRAGLRADDLVILTADHGCDPSWPGSDHTREYVPILGFGPHITPRDIGGRSSFADIGQSVARHLGLPPLAHGETFLNTPIRRGLEHNVTA
ncbi:phosphopentomutase [Sphingopyxis sp. SE2]|uniref:phosphopentomutase n=1 Tax=Sphingopyxis sp. SE2 TaxID=1586240 RepID=UPI0028C056FE|nr:phosphopentomutase [Sphingopyxis sp. SE2]MDT7531627.1 phosphopentomutase [Sphingopyxis sp. SE2]